MSAKLQELKLKEENSYNIAMNWCEAMSTSHALPLPLAP